MPIGVTLTMTDAVRRADLGRVVVAEPVGQRRPARPRCARRRCPTRKPWSRNAAPTALAMPPLPRISTVRVGFEPVLVDQPLHGEVVGVGRGQHAVVVDDGVDRVDRPRRRLDLVDEGDDVLLERHRHRAAADAERAHAADGGGDVGGGERLVDEVEAELVVEVVVEPGADVARPRGQRDAQPGVLVQRRPGRISPPPGSPGAPRERICAIQLGRERQLAQDAARRSRWSPRRVRRGATARRTGRGSLASGRLSAKHPRGEPLRCPRLRAATASASIRNVPMPRPW